MPEVVNSALATFAGQVTAHREQRKWSKAQLATRMGFDASYIAHVENMTKPPQMTSTVVMTIDATKRGLIK